MWTHAHRATLPARELLATHRTILVRGVIDDRAAEPIIAMLLYLQHADARAPAVLYIDSPGGLVTSALAILATVDDLRLPVFTHCFREAAGTALVLLAHGARGHRSAAPHARLVLTRVTPGADAARLDAILTASLAVDSGQPADAIARDAAATRFFDAETARGYGLIDRVEE